MINKLIESRYFEKNCFSLRKYSPYLNMAYESHYGINIENNSNITNDDRKKCLKASKSSLNSLRRALDIESTNSNVPKSLWLYWNSDIDKAPEVVRVSIESWKKLNPDYTVTIINDNNIKDVLGFDFNAVFQLATVNLGLAMKADILRLYLLSMYGGVWADTTTFCLKSLDTWLPEQVKDTKLFFFRHESNKTRPIEAWFIAANQGNSVIKNTLKLFLEHLFKPRTHSLFISNRIKSIGKRDSEQERFFKEVVFEAEEKGFMPYFSVGYFFNDSLRKDSELSIWEDIKNSTNNCVVNHSPFDKFTQSYVSKQTYKKDYQDSSLFKERIEYMKGTVLK
ncbi:capsular polysaccharide synthesis protein [Vibrio crassostreae]|uniref:capsular polysaccharide synthesis protein n=1 Tax=Vibrio crassostreae TaxID=246167 RepID=UPI001053F9FA|nr:capsular polysaccharide synthesis protein [Vibrio crassostreae]TCN84382.1 capsular polysaccharide synthesis protein [Vibrio crassostreae]TCN92827.1 capsular polysaccharide synthesis protein [Vibrio crassostreae]CAK1934439.1 Capsular polysaccharide synthesis protein [Vibrio crassostreae]CAK1942665.1 Capsular polysaccharide synthesis protein [Vibrio crassostreae]CAK1948024.1 Capsular polysaccharide synthesis protein [Vibrio crassostreae]